MPTEPQRICYHLIRGHDGMLDYCPRPALFGERYCRLHTEMRLPVDPAIMRLYS
jgi:hypothetical protein